MHYQSDITTFDSKLWTREELDRWLTKRFKDAKLVLPDDNFYGRAHSKAEIVALADKLKAQFKIKQTIDYSLSENTKAPGKCSLIDKQIRVSLPLHIYGDPLKAASYLSHMLAHALLFTERKQLLDQQENERFADMACVQAGLGIIVLNGSNKGGWRTVINKKSLDSSDSLGYFTVSHFAQKVRTFIDARSLDQTRIATYIVPWLRSHITDSPHHKNAKIPSVLKAAHKSHRASKRWLATICLLCILLGGISGYFGFKKTWLADEALITLRQKATSLKESYEACIARYEDLRSELPKDQISSERLLSHQQLRCKSLQNQYNSATKTYNQYIQSK